NAPDRSPWTLSVKDALKADGSYTLRVAQAQGDQVGTPSAPITVVVRTHGPSVIGVTPPDFGTAPGIQTVTVKFNPENPLDQDSATNKFNYVLRSSGGTGLFDRGIEQTATPAAATYDVISNSVALTFDRI